MGLFRWCCGSGARLEPPRTRSACGSRQTMALSEHQFPVASEFSPISAVQRGRGGGSPVYGRVGDGGDIAQGLGVVRAPRTLGGRWNMGWGGGGVDFGPFCLANICCNFSVHQKRVK